MARIVCLWAIMLGVALCLTVAPLALAEGDGAAEGAAAKGKAAGDEDEKVETIQKASISAVDAENSTVTVKARARKKDEEATETVLAVNDDTEIKLNKEDKTLADLKVGDRVMKIEYVVEEGDDGEEKNVAKTMILSRRAARKKRTKGEGGEARPKREKRAKGGDRKKHGEHAGGGDAAGGNAD